MNIRYRRGRGGFTLVELLVVIGIIAMLVSMLLPALNRIRQQAVSLKCKAQMRDIGIALEIYSTTYKGWLYPVGDYVPQGTGNPPAVKSYYKTLGIEPGQPDDGKYNRWPIYAFPEQGVWNPPFLKCPADQDPAEEHTYILNKHLADRAEKLFRNNTQIPGRSTSEILLLGEKRTEIRDYYMGRKETDPVDSEFLIVEPYKHGLKLGSNYLFVDYHVDILTPKQMAGTQDPWDVNMGTDGPATTTTTSTGGGAPTP